ncbi:PREDICTED: longitudinals lacking protein, isoforms A/B/D/L-like [Vollenhovia emeryi]|uniref:longitudinals lacking protein, isoforms A/B/D/L-like n=1 Tax=Vollenhovia emeryi TaxID=411798 RepID=UPI0005F57192|nr:PREDICTED: longitudinals lacking protein, isoforms A/B/D/L-like [Vollenhovia emeryi]
MSMSSIFLCKKSSNNNWTYRLTKKQRCIGKFACPNPKCRSAFMSQKNLQFHIRYYCTQKPRFKCPYCDYIVKYKADIRKHILRKHKNSYVYVIDTSEQKVLE